MHVIFAQVLITTILYDKKNKFKFAMTQFHVLLYMMIVPDLIILGLIMEIKMNFL